MEIWKNIDGYNGEYQVSNYGNIKSYKYSEPRILRFNYDKQNYKLVHLCKNGKRVCEKVHRLVALAFIPNIDNKPYVNHIDGNKGNNFYENLEWCTPSENNIHAYKTGLTNPVLNLHKNTT